MHSHEFKVVRRGYDPEQVEADRRDLLKRISAAEAQVEQLRSRPRVAVETPHETLGKKLTKILQLAEEEASEMRDRATTEVGALRSDVETSVRRLRDEADTYAAKRTDEADTYASTVVEDSKRMARDLVDSAHREAEAQRQEAGALVETQRANAAIAANTFETELATRREQSERSLRVAISDHQSRMLDLDEHLEKRRVEAERRHHETVDHSRRILEDAHARADEIIAEAKVSVEHIRADSDREIAALAEKRDSINAQLTNVREMLSALTSGTPALDPLAMQDAAETIEAETAEVQIDDETDAETAEMAAVIDVEDAETTEMAAVEDASDAETTEMAAVDTENEPATSKS